jgi:hypothetical protein
MPVLPVNVEVLLLYKERAGDPWFTGPPLKIL